MADPRSLWEAVAATAKNSPFATAAAAQDASVTYEQLLQSSCRVARGLESAGLSCGDRVLIDVAPSLEGLALLYGCSALGIAFAVAPPGMSPAQRSQAFRALGARARIRDRAAAPGEEASQELLLDELISAEGSADLPEPSLEALAYAFFTSGSTGAPKIACHSNRSAMSFLTTSAVVFGVHPDDHLVGAAPWSSDLAVFDLFCPSVAGASLMLLPPGSARFPGTLLDEIAVRRPTVWQSTPFVLRLLTRSASGVMNALSSLRSIMFAGEVFPVKDLQRLHVAAPSATLRNIYGSTEANDVTSHTVSSYEVDAPIGGPLPGVDLRIEGSDGGEAVEGELLVRSPFLMRGYWGDDAATSAVFLDSPDGSPWYRTRDLVCRNRDGSLTLVGRVDRVAKIRGAQVDLAALEALAREIDGVIDAAAIVLGAERMDAEPVLFFVGDAAPSRLRDVLRARLPVGAMPRRIVSLDELPRTATGKVDGSAFETWQ